MITSFPPEDYCDKKPLEPRKPRKKINKIRLVVCGVHPSVHAAHQASAEEIGVSVTSVYNKINGIEPSINGELVREVARQMKATIRHLNATMPDLLPGYRVKIIESFSPPPKRPKDCSTYLNIVLR
ncbi:MAG: hypothetical protein ACYTX0_46045 [Nostoc sp.]